MREKRNNGHSRLAAMALRCQPDSRLVGLVREGHDPAFEEIVRRYRGPLVTYAGGIVPDHHAEDVVQEALTRAHSALGRSDAEMNLKPWLFTIVRNGALNALRNEPVHVHLDENYDGVPQPPEVAVRREELAALTASVKNLPDQQREALIKRELEGRSHEEIAGSLGLSAGAVRGLIYRARATLRDGTGMLIPLPVLRALLSSAPASPEATGAAAAGLVGGGGGIALKAGATLGVAVIAVGSGIAVQHRDDGSGKDPAAATAPSDSASAHGAGDSGHMRLADAAVPGARGTGNAGEGSGSSGPGGARGDSSGSSSGHGSGEHSGGGGSSGSGPGSGGSGDDSGHSGSGSSDDSGSGSGSSGSGDDGGGSTTSGHDDGGGGSSGSGSDDTTSGSGSSGDDGGSSGSGSSGSGSGDDGGGTTTTTDGSGGDTTTTTTTTDGGDGGGTSGGSD